MPFFYTRSSKIEAQQVTPMFEAAARKALYVWLQARGHSNYTSVVGKDDRIVFEQPDGSDLPAQPGDWIILDDTNALHVLTGEDLSKYAIPVTPLVFELGAKTLAEIKTYGDLLVYLCQASPEVLAQKIQVMQEPESLEPVIAIGAVGEMAADVESRSSYDCQHHPDDVVLLRDSHPFNKHGDAAYTMVEGGMVGTQTKRFYPDGKDE